MQYGDILIGNKGAFRYGVTTTGTTWIYLCKDKPVIVPDVIYVVNPSAFLEFQQFQLDNDYTIHEAARNFDTSMIFPVRGIYFDVVRPSENRHRIHSLQRLDA